MSGARRERLALGAMVLATLLWGATFVVIRDSLANLDPGPLVWARFAAATIAFLLLRLARPAPLGAEELRGGIVAGGCAAAGFLCQATGLASTSAGSSAFLTCAGTLFAGFFAWPLLRQRPGLRLVAGIALALAGSALLSLRGGLRLGAGEAWTLLGALAYALQIVALARFARRADPVGLTLVQVATIALVASPWAAAGVRQVAALGGAGLARFAYLALAGSLIAPLLQVRAQRDLGAGRVGLLFALEPLFALAFALTLGAERFAPRWWAGAALIVGAVLLVEARPPREPAASP